MLLPRLRLLCPPSPAFALDVLPNGGNRRLSPPKLLSYPICPPTSSTGFWLWFCLWPRAAMAPSFLNLKELRRRSTASFRTKHSTDTSSNSDHNSHDTTPTTGSITPPSLAAQSDPALHLQMKDQSKAPPVPSRPPLQQPSSSSSNRYSVSGMTGLGSPSLSGRNTLPVSQYAPRIVNLTENAWVCSASILSPFPAVRLSYTSPRLYMAMRNHVL